MVNTRSTKYEVCDEHEETHSIYSNESESCVSDNDSEYVPSDGESEEYQSDVERLSVATTLLSLKNSKMCKTHNDSDSDSDYEPEEDSDDDCYVGGIKTLRGMPAPSGVHIRFD